MSFSWLRRGGNKSIENILSPDLKKGDDCFLVRSEYVSHWEEETQRAFKYGDGQYEYRGHKYTHLQKEDYQKFSDWYSAHGSELDQMSTSIVLQRKVIEVHGPEGMTCMIDLNPLQIEVEIITKSIVELDSNISVADATSELCKRYNASRGQLYVKHHSQYQLLEWSRGTLREQLRQFQSKTICFEIRDITELSRDPSVLQNLGDKCIENISSPELKKGDDCFLVRSEYVSHWEEETQRAFKYGSGQYEYRGHKYKHLHREDYQEFSAWYCAHGSKVVTAQMSIALQRKVIEVHGPEGKTCGIDFDPLQIEVEIITKSIVQLDSNISVADATSELCQRYNASRGQLYVKHHSQYKLLEWSRGTLREQLRQFQSKTIYFEKSDIIELSRGLCGLQNLGNTCFMNSALQCLSSTEPLRDVFLKEEYHTYINVSNPLGMQGQIASTFGNLMNDMWRQDNRVIAPRDLKKLIGKFAPQFSGNHQQDAHELLLFMLDGLHEDLKNTDDPMDVPVDPETAVGAWITHQVENRSRIMEIFHGQTQVVLKCHKCHKTEFIFDPFSFLTLQLPMETNATVTGVTTSSSKLVTVTFVDLYNEKKKHIIEGATFTTTLKGRLESKTEVPKSEIIIVEVKDYKIKTVLLESDHVPEQVHAYQFKAKGGHKPVFVNLLGSSEKGFYDPMILSLPTQFKDTDVTQSLMEKLKFTLPEGQSIAHDDWPHKQPIAAMESVSQHVKGVEYSAAATMSTDTHPAKQYGKQSVFGNEGVGMDVYTPAPTSFTPRKLKQNTEVVMPHPPSKVYPSEDSVTILGVRVYNSVWGPDMQKYISSQPKEIIQPQLTPKKAKVITVHDCIAIFTASKEYTESDNWYCQHCNQIAPGKRTCKLRELPDVLIIHLKRFTSPRNKINYHVVFPIRGLDMSKYMAVSDAKGRAPVYDLFAVCNHAGRMASGHYTAYTKRTSSNGQEEWYIFDDTYVGKIDEKEVVNPNAYILFYMRCSKTKSSA